MAFKLNGKPITAIAAGTIETQVRRVARRLADDDLIDAEQMAQSVGHSRAGLINSISKLKLSDVGAKIRVGTKLAWVFGNPKTIQKLVTALERA